MTRSAARSADRSVPRRPARLAVAAVLAASFAAAGPARATATLDCSIDDRTLSLALQASVAHGLAEQFSSLRGELTLKARGVASAGALELSGDHLAHTWLHGRELKLRLYLDAEDGKPKHPIDLVLETTRSGGSDDEATGYAGRYLLRVVTGDDGATKTFRGKATCSIG